MFGRDSVLKKLIECPAFGDARCEASAERRAVFEIHRHGGENDFCAGIQPGLQNVIQVPLEISIDSLSLRVVGRDLVLHKHFHSMPAGSSGTGFLELLGDIEH